MGLGPRALHKAGRRFPAGGKRGRGAKGSGRPSSGRQRQVCPPRDGRSQPALEAHPHLSAEALGYFRRALSALKEAPETGEERELMVHNVLKEAEAQALALATNRTGSEMLQELLGFSPLKPLCRVLAALRSSLRSVACHRCGVHVLQSALLQLPRLLGSPMEDEEVEEDGKDRPLETLEELVLGLSSEVCDDFLFYCGDTHGSFVVRTLLQVLGGTLLESERARHRGSQSPEAQRAPARECKPTDFEVPESFLNHLQDLSSCFLKDIGVFITDKISSFCFQVALQILHRKLPQFCAHLCDAVIDYLSNRNSSADGSPLLLFLRDQTSSRLLEQVLLVLEPLKLQSLFEDHFQGQLQTLAAHPIANFPLQRLLDAITTSELLSPVFEELSPALEAVLAQGHPGVVIALVGACRRVGTHQAQVLQLLLEAFHCAEPSSRQVACVPLFATLMAYEVYYGLVEEEGAVPAEHQVEMGTARALGEVTVLGSLLLQHLGRHVVVELITCNVILPLISKLSDPDWIHLVLVSIFSKARDTPAGMVKSLCPARALEQPSVPTSLPLIVEVQSLPEVRAPSPAAAPALLNCEEPEGLLRSSPEIEEGHEAVEGDFGGVPEERKVGNNSSHFLQPDIRGPLFLCEDSELESPLSELGKETIMLMTPGNYLSDRIQDALCALGGSQSLQPKDEEGSEGIEGAEAEEGPGTETETGLLDSMLNSCPEIQIDTADKEVEQDVTSPTTLLASPERTCPPRPSCLEKDLTNGVSSLDPSLPQDLLSSSPPGPLSSATFSFEPLSSPDGPVVIQNLRITGTITAREHSGTGFHPYTLYTVKYETALDSENSSNLQQLAYHTVNRRYREFLNLQTRLEEKSDLRKFIKNVKGPKKLFPDLPFGNMDSDRVEARKSLLESFLKQLCAIPEIANSEEVQEFLALNTDARIAFVKKPFVVSRIDKMVVNAIVDTLKTAFPRSEPQSPTEELSEAETESRPQSENKKASKSRLRFSSSKIAPALNMTEAQEKILYCLQEGNVESEILSMSGMESFLEKQTKLLEMQPGEAPEKDPEHTHKGCVDGCLSDAAEPAQDLSNSDPGAETELADTALDLLLLLLMEQWTWLCTESMQKVLHLVFGTLIQRWLEVQVANLTCPQCWVQYLQLLQESIWPGGVLPKHPRPRRTQEQKVAAKKQALQTLMGILPGIVVEILGVNKCQLSWSLVLESLQQPLINRHLIYCLWDIILEFLDLSASVEESAITTSASDTPDNPKRMGVSP